MTTAGDNITKANIVAAMEAVRETYVAGIGWGTNAQPFQTDITGGSTGGYSFTMAADITDTNITASTLVTNFKSYATLLSRIRNVRLLKYYQIQGDVRGRTDFDQTTMTNLNANYAADMGAVGIFNTISDFTAVAADIDSFVSALSTAINTNRTSTVTIEEFYCHSNCHGSCHGSI